jgi:hypothetical protein
MAGPSELGNWTAKALIIVGSLIAAINWSYWLRSHFTGKYHSLILPLGGILLAVGFAFHPVLLPYFFCGLVLDIGFWAILFALPKPRFILDPQKSSRLENTSTLLANKASDNVDLMPDQPPKAGIICPKCGKPTKRIVVETDHPTNLTELLFEDPAIARHRKAFQCEHCSKTFLPPLPPIKKADRVIGMILAGFSILVIALVVWVVFFGMRGLP